MWTDFLALAHEHEALTSIAAGGVFLVVVAIVAAAMDWFVGRAEAHTDGIPDPEPRRSRSTLRLLCFFMAVAMTWGWARGVLALQQVPSATETDRLMAQLEVSGDGNTVTVRSVAPDSLRLCVAPRAGAFGPTRCFTVADIRRGRVVRQ